VSPHYSAIYFTFIHVNYSTQLVRNGETRWNYKTGFKIRNRVLTIDTFDASKTREKKQARIEKIFASLVPKREAEKNADYHMHVVVRRFVLCILLINYCNRDMRKINATNSIHFDLKEIIFLE
jgi:hypothetical protein